MGAGPSGKGDTGQVSGNEAVETASRRGKKNEINKDQKQVGTYGDTNTGSVDLSGKYSKENQNPNNNIQTKKNTTTYNGGGNGGEGNNTIVNKTIGGTKIQTTEAKVEKAADLTAEQILLRNKKRGRKMTMMSGAKGVTRTSSDYSLGKKSLLGIV